MARRRGVLGFIEQVAIIMIIVGGIIAVSQSFVTLAGLQLPTILTDMPTFYEYAEDGTRALTTAECNQSGEHLSWECMAASQTCTDDGRIGCEAKETGYLRFYWFLAQYSMAIMIFVVAISVMEYVMSGTGFTSNTNAIERIKKIIPFLIIITILPAIWDPVAISIENTALFLMAPFPDDKTAIGIAGIAIDQTTLEGRAAARSAWLWMEAGHIIPPSTWDPETWSTFLVDPAKFTEEVITVAFLGVFKAYVVILLGIEMWVTGVLRVVLTMIILISVPIFLPMTLIPKIGRHADDYVNGIFGLAMAPILSAVIFTAGVAYLQSSFDQPALIRWLSAVCVCFLCSSAVTSVGGSLLMTTKGDVMSAMKTALSAAAMTVSAAVSGGVGAVTGGGGGASGAGMIGGVTKGIAGGVAGGVVQGVTSGAISSAAQTGSLGDRGPTQHGTSKAQIMPDSRLPNMPGSSQPGSGVIPGSAGAQVGPDGGYVPASAKDSDDDTGAGAGADSQDTPSFRHGHGFTKPDSKPESGEAPNVKMQWWKDKAAAFMLGAVAGSAGPIMQGSLPEGFGMEKITEPLAERATQVSEGMQQQPRGMEKEEEEESTESKDLKKGKNPDDYTMYGGGMYG